MLRSLTYNFAFIYILMYSTNLGSASLSSSIHFHMHESELNHYFGTVDPAAVPEYEVVNLQTSHPNINPDEFDLSLEAFGNNFQLDLKLNQKLLSPLLQIVLRGSGPNETIEAVSKQGAQCHYLHNSESTTAALSLCETSTNTFRGFITSRNETFEIHPINERLLSKMNQNLQNGRPHIMKRAMLPDTMDNIIRPKRKIYDDTKSTISRKGQGLVLETAVFLDNSAYHNFGRYMGYDMIKLRDFLLTYMNGIQSVYHSPSLKHNGGIDISVVRIEILTKQPVDLPTRGVESGTLLNNFCAYQSDLNRQDRKWDIALYVSGLNFFSLNRGRKSDKTMGLAGVGGICSQDYNCVIGEFGVTSPLGKPFPSAGFTAVYVMAHEIGHNLGMHHDGSRNGCDENGFLMSNSRGTKGETRWSRCSIDALSDALNSGRLDCLMERSKSEEEFGLLKNAFPGLEWTADRQCQIFLLDKEASMDHKVGNHFRICTALRCKTPKRDGWFRAGPALEGTKCGNGFWCRDGKCVKNKEKIPMSKEENLSTPSHWSSWKKGVCKSGCISGSRSFQKRKRHCIGGQINTPGGCFGVSSSVQFCSSSTDQNLCPNGFTNVLTFASSQCKTMKNIIKVVNITNKGIQVRYHEERPELACSIYCRRTGKGGWYTPRLELNNLPDVSSTFPDGTPCHSIPSKNINYYCQQGLCVDENARVAKAKNAFNNDVKIDINNNAVPQGNGDGTADHLLMKYFTLNDDLSLNDDGIFLPSGPLNSVPDESEWQNFD